MMTTRQKNKRILRILLLLGVPLVTTLMLLMGTAVLHTPGFSPFSFAHAMTLQSTCASTQGTQPNLCNQQNPVAQQCAQDAQSIEVVSVFTTQNTLIGEVDIRHSNICKASWVRTIAYTNASQVQAVDATISLNDGKVQDHQNTIVQPGQRLIAFTDMTQPTVLPKTLAGIFHLRGQTQPMTIPL
jgi:hypothetical protein